MNVRQRSLLIAVGAVLGVASTLAGILLAYEVGTKARILFAISSVVYLMLLAVYVIQLGYRWRKPHSLLVGSKRRRTYFYVSNMVVVASQIFILLFAIPGGIRLKTVLSVAGVGIVLLYAVGMYYKRRLAGNIETFKHGD